jgi:hypothetical protein
MLRRHNRTERHPDDYAPRSSLCPKMGPPGAGLEGCRDDDDVRRRPSQEARSGLNRSADFEMDFSARNFARPKLWRARRRRGRRVRRDDVLRIAPGRVRRHARAHGGFAGIAIRAQRDSGRARSTAIENDGRRRRRLVALGACRPCPRRQIAEFRYRYRDDHRGGSAPGGSDRGTHAKHRQHDQQSRAPQNDAWLECVRQRRRSRSSRPARVYHSLCMRLAQLGANYSKTARGKEGKARDGRRGDCLPAACSLLAAVLPGKIGLLVQDQLTMIDDQASGLPHREKVRKIRRSTHA